MLILFLLQQWISSLVDNDSVAYRNPQNQAPFLMYVVALVPSLRHNRKHVFAHINDGMDVTCGAA
jgi:hypothetical protein